MKRIKISEKLPFIRPVNGRGSKLNILLIEDVPHEAELVTRALKRGNINFDLFVVNSKKSFEVALKEFLPHVIVFDNSIPSFNAYDALTMVKMLPFSVPFIVITSIISDDLASDLIRSGVDDYLAKDSLHRLPLAVANAVERYQLMSGRLEDCEKHNGELQNIIRSLQMASKSAGVGIWDWDIENNRMQWDDSLLYLYRVDAINPVYEGWMSQIHPEDQSLAQNDIEFAISGQKEYNTEFRIVCGDGEIRTLRATGIVEKNEDGVPVRMIGLNWDITERLRYTAAIEKQNQQLKEIAFMQAHIVRAPLARILGLIELFFGENDNNLRCEIAGYLKESASEMDEVIKNIIWKASDMLV